MDNTVMAAAIGLLLGAALGAWFAGARNAGAQARMALQFQELSAAALERNNAQFVALAEGRLRVAETRATGELEQRRQAVEQLVVPLREALDRVELQLRGLEQARTAAYASLVEQVGFVRETSEQLRAQTASLVGALRAPQARGRWGEMQLRRVVEVAGMVEHCDFDEQPTLATADGVQRPDLVVRLSGGRSVVVDAKVPLSAYLEAADASDDARRKEHLAGHARQLRSHVDALAGKAYWSAVSPAPEFVVLFVPGEAFLAPALEHDPGLLEHAMSRRVVVATPTTLIALLRTVAFSWQQAALTDNARVLFDAARELHGRLATFAGHVDRMGRALGRAVGDYNAAVGSLETRVLPQLRRIRDTGAVDADVPPPRPIDDAPRSVTVATEADASGW
jgi:DNA recombination protein RmuC